MVQINMNSKEITLKVVYYGPALSGKTSNLQKLHDMMDPSRRSHMLTLDTRTTAPSTSTSCRSSSRPPAASRSR